MFTDDQATWEMSDNHTKHVDPCVMIVQGRATYSVSRETKLKSVGRIVSKYADSQDKQACWQVWMKVHIFRIEICVVPLSRFFTGTSGKQRL